MSKSKKPANRPPGSPNKKSAYVRDQVVNFRATTGFVKTLEELITAGVYKSKADAMHDALQILAARKLPATFYWYDKIQ